MNRDEIKTLAVNMAFDIGVRHEWALAFIQVESGFDPLAVRYEPFWRYPFKIQEFSKITRINATTEKMLQSCSFGLLQVMGTVARELGFHENILKLSDPQIGLKYGLMKMKSLVDKYGYTDDMIASYNAGSPLKNTAGKYSNQEYVDKIRDVLNGKIRLT